MMAEAIVAYVLINVDVGKEKEVLEEILKRYGRNVTEARVTYGDFDLIVRLEAGNMRLLDKIVTGIRSIPGVLRTTTLIAS